MSKGRLRHLSFSVPDPWASAEFYKAAFGLEIIGETDGEMAEGVYLSDGVIQIALLCFKTDAASQGTGKEYVGLHHIGFWVDNVEKACAAAKAAGASWVMGDVRDKGGFEVKYRDPDGVIMDITQTGWAGSQKSPGESDNVVAPRNRPYVDRFAARRERAKDEAARRRTRALASD